MTWSVVIPVKPLAVAKSRLGGTLQPRLALAFVQDTVAAAAAASTVARVLVVTDDDDVRVAVQDLGAMVRPDTPRNGLNPSIRSGAAYALSLAGVHPVAALPSDLPALTGAVLDGALSAAGQFPHAFVRDAAGSGTTLITALTGGLEPRYGPGSAAEHVRAGVAELAGEWPGLRLDVDTMDDLLIAGELGLGARTAALLDEAVATGSGCR